MRNCHGKATGLAACVVGVAMVACLAASGPLAVANQAQPATPRVTLSKGATLEQCVAELARALDGGVVADLGVKERTLQQALNDVPLQEALAAVSIDYDRYCVLRGRTLALQLRRNDVEEPAPLEMAEAEAIVADLPRLVSLSPEPPSGLALVVAQQRQQGEFVASLTPDQVERMSGDGLPFAALHEDQRDRLLLFSFNMHFGHFTGIRAYAKLLSQPGRTTVAGMRSVNPNPAGGPDVVTEWLQLSAPDPSNPGKEVGNRLEVVSDVEATRRFERYGRGRKGAGPIAEGENLGPPAPREAPPARIVAQTLTLRQFSGAWREAIGSDLRIPEYAADRQFAVCSVGASRTELAQALADLWGWETHVVGEVRRLARPIITTPNDIDALLGAMRRAIPPSIRHPARAGAASIRRYDPRRTMRQRRRLYQQVLETASGADQPVSLTKLTEEERRVLTTVLLEALSEQWFKGNDNDLRPVPEYLASPERITLKLTGPIQRKQGDPLGQVSVNTPNGGWAWPARAFTYVQIVPKKGQ